MLTLFQMEHKLPPERISRCPLLLGELYLFANHCESPDKNLNDIDH